ncbi:MAG: AtpZ/AtpI family protein [Elusimicrobiaceae bacterium]|nr:AtpZ/AtpI family protein [Elusimicrobiaceae bacterium]
MRKQDHLLITGLGTEFCIIMLIGTFAGYFIDKKLETSPFFILIGVAGGFALGLYVLINTALNISKKWEKKNKEVK